MGVNKHALHLGRLGSMTMLVNGAAQPSGSIAAVLNDQCTIYLKVADLVDLAGEVTKQEKKLADTQKMLASYAAKMAAPNYEERVPEHVRKLNSDKHTALSKEIVELQAVIASLKSAAK